MYKISDHGLVKVQIQKVRYVKANDIHETQRKTIPKEMSFIVYNIVGSNDARLIMKSLYYECRTLLPS